MCFLFFQWKRCHKWSWGVLLVHSLPSPGGSWVPGPLPQKLSRQLHLPVSETIKPKTIIRMWTLSISIECQTWEHILWLEAEYWCFWRECAETLQSRGHLLIIMVSSICSLCDFSLGACFCLQQIREGDSIPKKPVHQVYLGELCVSVELRLPPKAAVWSTKNLFKQLSAACRSREEALCPLWGLCSLFH